MWALRNIPSGDKPLPGGYAMMAGLTMRAKIALNAALLGLGSFGLFVWNITRPATIYFDEVHYVPAARALLERTAPTNIEHPLFAKTLIAAGIALFGDNPLGWRLPSALFACVAVLAVFWIGMLLFGELRSASCAALLLVFNQTHFIQARIGMLEMPMTGCLLLGAACLLQARRGDARWAYAGAVALGLAMGSKWLALPYGALFLAARAWDQWRDSGRDETFLLDHVLPDAARLGALAALVYFASFAPAFFYTHDAMTLRHLIGFQFEMLASQRAPLAAHPYQSDWWQWPLMLRPIWYIFAQNANNYQAILLIGNPLIYWGGAGVVALSISGWLKRRDKVLLGLVGLYLFSLAIWIIIPKQIGFFYYYNFSAVILCLVLVAFLRLFDRRRLRLVTWFTLASAIAFTYFYPIIAADPLPKDDTWTEWVWMKSWS